MLYLHTYKYDRYYRFISKTTEIAIDNTGKHWQTTVSLADGRGGKMQQIMVIEKKERKQLQLRFAYLR